MKLRSKLAAATFAASMLVIGMRADPAQAQDKKPNIILIVSDDFG